MKSKRLTPKKNKAQAMVEFAIALPILLLLIYGLLETGRLLFTYSSVTNATRQAVRYGSTTGAGTGGVPRWKDCAGIKAAAQQTDFLNVFADSDITIWYDSGPGTGSLGNCGAVTSLGTANKNRVVVSINSNFVALVPKLVPFVSRTITTQSARTVITSIIITGAVSGGAATPTPTNTPTNTPTFTPSNTPTKTKTPTAGPSPTNTKTFTPGPSPTSSAPACAVDYVVNQWDTGFTANITITNNGGAAINGYTLSWIFTAGQQVTSSWNATFSQSGSSVNASNPAGNWNGTIAANGGTVSFGFQGTHTGSNPTPASFTLNGLLCSGGSPLPTPTLTPSMTPSPIPTGSNCSQVTHGPLVLSNGSNTMSMTINNPLATTLAVQDVTVYWNATNGRSGGAGGRALPLIGAALGSSFYSGTVNTSPFTITPASLTIPTGSSTIVFTFQYNYANKNNSERIVINLSTPGCTVYPIDSSN